MPTTHELRRFIGGDGAWNLAGLCRRIPELIRVMDIRNAVVNNDDSGAGGRVCPLPKTCPLH